MFARSQRVALAAKFQQEAAPERPEGAVRRSLRSRTNECIAQKTVTKRDLIGKSVVYTSLILHCIFMFNIELKRALHHPHCIMFFGTATAIKQPPISTDKFPSDIISHFGNS